MKNSNQSERALRKVWDNFGWFYATLFVMLVIPTVEVLNPSTPYEVVGAVLMWPALFALNYWLSKRFGG